jgi:hypothetical protein
MRAGLIAPGAVVLAPNAPPAGTATATGPPNAARRHPPVDAPREKP